MARGELLHERLTHSVIGAFFDVYNTLGFGFLESIYAAALTLELRRREHRVEREVSVRVGYKGAEIGWQRLDMLVDGLLVVEIKSTAELHPTARRQLLNYLCATRLELGLLLHFGPTARVHRVLARHDGLEWGSHQRGNDDVVDSPDHTDRPGEGASREEHPGDPHDPANRRSPC